MAQGYINKSPVIGNRSGEVSLSNGTLCTGLDSDLLDGYHVTPGVTSGRIPIMSTGSWTPSFSGGFTSISYTECVGWYRRIGAIVWVWGTIQVSSVSVDGNTVHVSGWPFTINYLQSMSATMGNTQMYGNWGNQLTFCISNSTSGQLIIGINNGTFGVAGSQVLRAGTRIRFTGCYRTSSATH